MILTRVISMLLICILSTSCKHGELIGTWRRIDEFTTQLEKENIAKQWGDLTIRADSTFHIEGDNTSDTISKVSGWHVGSESKGTWERSGKDNLYFRPEEFNKTIFRLPYKIVRLTKKKLVLISTLGKPDKNEQMVYKRI